MTNRDIVAIGTSAGGVEALIFLASQFSSTFPASVLVTIHLPSHTRSVLDDIMTRAGPLPATEKAEIEREAEIIRNAIRRVGALAASVA